MQMISDLVYGKNPTEWIVSIEVDDSVASLYKNDGTVEVIPNEYYLLFEKQGKNRSKLGGDLHYNYVEKFGTSQEFYAAKSFAEAKGEDYHAIWNPKEQLMVRKGYTYYKGLNHNDLGVLSFDIETNGLTLDDESTIFLIASIYRKDGNYERQIHFNVNEWAEWVREKNPDVLLGHNILGFDLPFMAHCSGDLNLGREGQRAKFAKRSSEFRKDGSQSYSYKNVLIHGREIVDTFHLSLKYDIKRQYPSYGLKAIAKHEGLASDDREYYDASKIGENWDNLEEREKIIRYAYDDAEEALKLFDLMIPSFFYYAQSVPKSFQQVITGASGSQLNSIMCRSYLQKGHSIPKASESVEYEGALSGGNPGVYKHVNKVDVASMYPSIILRDSIEPKGKDPNGNFLKIVEFMTLERLKNKKLGKETKDRSYKDLEQAQKIIINSAYGFLAAPGLNFNDPKAAAMITRKGRGILDGAMTFAKELDWDLVNWDTDSFSYTTGKKLTKKLFKEHIIRINGVCHDAITWEDDGQYKAALIVKTKNYVLMDYKGNMTIKGAALLGTTKEKSLQYFMKDIINVLIRSKKTHVFDLYHNYARRIKRVDDINDWAAKKTVTKAVLEGEDTTQRKIREAIGSKSVKEGDKVFVYFKEDESLGLVEEFDGRYNRDRLYNKLHSTLEVFNTVIDTSLFPNYSQVGNRPLLQLHNH